MKFYERLKGKGKSFKLGVVGAGFCLAGALVTPCYSEVKQEQVIPPTKLEQVVTLEQVDALYKEKLNEYSSDKEIDSDEIGKLQGILVRKKELLDGKKPVIEKYLSTKKDFGVFSEKISKLEERLKHFGDVDNVFLDYLSDKKEKIEDLLNREYPSLINKKDAQFNIVYPADTKLINSELKSFIRESVKTLHSKISSLYSDNVLKKVSEKDKDSLDLRDVVKLLEAMGSYMLKFEKSNYVGITKEGLEKQIEDLKLQEKDSWNGVINVQEKENIEGYIKEVSDIDGILMRFSNYIAFEGKVKEFVEKFGDRNEYWSDSVLGESILHEKEGYKLYASFLKRNKEPIEFRLNQYLESEGLDAKVKEFKNPRAQKFPVWWCVLINGLFAPIARNLLVRKYVGANDGEDYACAFGAGFANGLVGVFVTDGLHPWAFWVRMATPLVIQPLRKILNK